MSHTTAVAESFDNPFGDAALYANRPVTFDDVASATSVVYAAADDAVPLVEPRTDADPYALHHASESVSYAAQSYTVHPQVSLRETEQGVFHDVESVTTRKAHILSRPKLLLNVLVFWINSLACHGLPQHNRTVRRVLTDLRQFVDETQSGANKEAMVRTIDDAVRDVNANLVRLDYDTTVPIIHVYNALGSEVLRDYMIARRILSPDPNVSDMATVWAEVIAAADPTLPFGLPKISDPSRLLDAMLWSQRVALPTLP